MPLAAWLGGLVLLAAASMYAHDALYLRRLAGRLRRTPLPAAHTALATPHPAGSPAPEAQDTAPPRRSMPERSPARVPAPVAASSEGAVAVLGAVSGRVPVEACVANRGQVPADRRVPVDGGVPASAQLPIQARTADGLVPVDSGVLGSGEVQDCVPGSTPDATSGSVPVHAPDGQVPTDGQVPVHGGVPRAAHDPAHDPVHDCVPRSAQGPADSKVPGRGQVPAADHLPANGHVPASVPSRVSVIIAARNEAPHIAAAASSLLAQDHPDLEFIVVDDRSTDGTGALIDQLAATDPRVQPVHIRDLPRGWLGKNHALATGAARATGPWLLFADADVRLHPTAVRRALAFAEARRLDHLTIGPAMTARGYWLQAWVALTVMMVMSFVSPRRMNHPRGRAGFGVGAFNLVRRTAYEASGTHRALALRPDDDVCLGMRLRHQGFRQWAAAEPDLAEVEWYPTIAAAVHGLEKNAFAVLNYRPSLVAAATAATLAMFLGPLAGALLLHGAQAWPYRATALLQAATVWLYATTFVVPHRPWRAALVALAYPVAALLYTYAMARSAVVALTRRGITWRDTFYPLDELRRHTGLD